MTSLRDAWLVCPCRVLVLLWAATLFVEVCRLSRSCLVLVVMAVDIARLLVAVRLTLDVGSLASTGLFDV